MPRKGSATSALLVGLVLGALIGAAATYLALQALRQQAAAGAELELLPNRAYFERVSRLIAGARRSVYVVMFVMKYDPNESPERDPANRLITLLVDAAARGVDVRVVVDDTTKQSYPETIAFLKSKGVPVKLDPKAGVTTHAKLVIVDGSCAVIGSHNWTQSALASNNELSVLTCSREVVEGATRYFMELWEGGRPA